MHKRHSLTPLARLSDAELQLLGRLSRRYCQAVTQYANFVTMMHRASATRDFAGYHAATELMKIAAQECRECQIALRVLQLELSAAAEPEPGPSIPLQT